MAPKASSRAPSVTIVTPPKTKRKGKDKSQAILDKEKVVFKELIDWLEARQVKLTLERVNMGSRFLSASGLSSALMTKELRWRFQHGLQAGPGSTVSGGDEDEDEEEDNDGEDEEDEENTLPLQGIRHLSLGGRILKVPAQWKEASFVNLDPSSDTEKNTKLCNDAVISSLFATIPKMFADHNQWIEFYDSTSPSQNAAYPESDINLFKYTDTAESCCAKRTIFQTLLLGTLAREPPENEVPELVIERWVGPIQGFFAVKDMTLKSNQLIPNPLFLSTFGATPKPDLASIDSLLHLAGLDYGGFLFLVFWAAEAKKENKQQTPQLAGNFQCTLNLLILLLINTHERDKTPIVVPEWCFLIGIIYDKFGIQFYAHYPTCSKTGTWGYTSISYDDEEMRTLSSTSMPDKARLVAKLLRAQRHACFVRQKVATMLKEGTLAFPECFHTCSAEWNTKSS